MNVLVCGGRNFSDRNFLRHTLSALLPQPTLIIEGGASGADTLAREWARDHGIKVMTCPARWGEQGRAAGPLRNQLMLEEGKPELVVAFAGGKGTGDMVRRALKAGVCVVLRTANDE